jgi:hypothetical protein
MSMLSKAVENYYMKHREVFKYDPKWNSKLDSVPMGAIGFVYGNNKLTNFWGKIETGESKSPTHCFLYENIDHSISEADVFLVRNRAERYLGKKKVIFFWFDGMDQIEMKRRADYIVAKKMFYDAKGFANFMFQLIPGINKLIRPSDTLMFCSEYIVAVYSGEKSNTDKEIAKWNSLKRIALRDDPNDISPAQIIEYLNAEIEDKDSGLHTLVIDKE